MNAQTTTHVLFGTDELDGWLHEDIGYFDLTSAVLEIGDRPARIAWKARGSVVAACTEEIVRLLAQRQVVQIRHAASGTVLQAGDVLIEAEGPAQALLDVWKVGQNLLEYACGVATRTHDLMRAVHAVDPRVGVLTTRKHPPGLRRVAIKATRAGGAWPHRLGLSETVVVFPQHRALLPEGGWASIRETLTRNAPGLAEKKIVIEAATLEEAELAVQAGADVIQFDKVMPEQLAPWCTHLRNRWPHLKILAAGGIRHDNVTGYAASGVDALVTSSLYYGAPADIGVTLAPG